MPPVYNQFLFRNPIQRTRTQPVMGTAPPTQAAYNIGLPSFGTNPQPSYGSGINDPTLMPGASYSGSFGGGQNIPTGALPIDPFNNANMNMMYQRGYRRKLINGQWYLVPPSQTPGPAAYNIH